MRIRDIGYVIVQAGGKGTRLEHHTSNKPKCLLSIDGAPILYHLFEQFPHSHFLIIGDYLYNVLDKYLRVVPPRVRYQLIRARHTGTLAGLQDAVDLIEDSDEPFLIVWSDLLFEASLDGEMLDRPLVGLSRTFLCRWSLAPDGSFANVPSATSGVAGFFCFPHKRVLGDLPCDGEFVQHLGTLNLRFTPLFLDNVYEFGTLDLVDRYRHSRPVARFFNTVEIRKHAVSKRARSREFQPLIDAEACWYEKLSSLGFRKIPHLLTREPFTIERINGRHPFEIDCPPPVMRRILHNIGQCLSELHRLDCISSEQSAATEMYLYKTVDRLESVRLLIPNVEEPTLWVNGVPCRNPLHPKYQDWLRDKVATLQQQHIFTIIHGDPTFSNILIDRHYDAWLIDPRGYFGAIQFYGDPRYDWAKLYYSVIGNYDQFNQKHFRLSIAGSTIDLRIRSNGWENQSPVLTEYCNGTFTQMNLIHALIWLSLTGYVKDDYDSVLASFYNGLYWLEATES
jgi:MobA-like NTP transferase domain